MSSHLESNPSTQPDAPVVLVTGAAKRLGREIALSLAKQGWQVAVHYRSSAQDATNTIALLAANTPPTGQKHHIFQCDLADEAATRALVPCVVQHFGRLDAVVNSAAAFEYDSASSFSYSALQKHMSSNTGAAILLAQALHEHMAARQPKGEAAAHGMATTTQGVVVNMLDQKLWNQNPDFFSYTLSKAALEAANTMLAMALAPLVRVVGVAPGLTLTSQHLTDAEFTAMHKLSPLGQSSTPHDVAATVRFALENPSITGTTLVVDGGQHLMRFERDFSMMTQP
ncbi:MAG TPA: SDR family oxidoreductase [Burkholderiaceae bacterium]|nr:SDR family oxidoreductase [Burkholderiaceae bacterium]